MTVIQELKHGSHDFARRSITFPGTEAHLKLQSYFKCLLIDALFIPEEQLLELVHDVIVQVCSEQLFDRTNDLLERNVHV